MLTTRPRRSMHVGNASGFCNIELNTQVSKMSADRTFEMLEVLFQTNTAESIIHSAFSRSNTRTENESNGWLFEQGNELPGSVKACNFMIR
jgi:hypothetical protein